MEITSTKDGGKRYAKITHDTNGCDFSIGASLATDGTEKPLYITIRFTMDDRRVCITLDPKEATTLVNSLKRYTDVPL